MREQDFIDNINEQTKDLPIPDSISPEAMKKMLDDNIEQNAAPGTSQADEGRTDNSASKDTTRKRRYIRRFTAAACVVICLAGSLGVSALLSDTTRNNTSSNNGGDDAISEKTERLEEELAYQTNLTSPDSYDDYYDTLKAAYDSYYDRISSVYTDGKIEEDIVFDSVTDSDAKAADASAEVNEAAAEDSISRSADTQSLTGAKENGKTASEKDYSTTNTQEKTVDEGDVIKTDGTYIYKVISGFDNDTGYTTYRLTITKTDNGNLNTITSFDLEDIIKKKNSDDRIQFQEFYLYDDQLILMYSRNNYSVDDPVNESLIAIYDLKDKAKPKKVKTLSQSGYYESSRISNGYLYTISNFSDTSLADKKKYTSYIPSINGEIIECNNIYYPKDVVMETTYVVTSLDLKNPLDFTDTKAVPTTGGRSYVSDSSIYFYADIYSDVTKTEIMKVGYEDGILTVGNSAVVAGYLYDSFALSEYNGYLRIIATIPSNNVFAFREAVITENSSSSLVAEDVNALYILDQNMELEGKLTGLAPGEQIYSARFMGDIGYFVTYRNTDPLFSVDLSDPANPKILGELKIPGFSNYLHFYSENTLLGIGQETDPDTQEFLGLKLSMFDISNPSDVKEEDKYIIENSDFSDALYNHKAIMIDPEKNIFGFMYYGAKGDGYQYGYYYATYTYDETEGFIETACYEINDGSEYEYDAVRGLYIGDYFYLATNKSITSYEIGSEAAIAVVYLK